MMITLLLLLYPLVTTAYNLDLETGFIIYEAPYSSSQQTRSSGSSFGYSVLLSSQRNILSNGSAVQKSWLIVGAPKANYTTKPGHGRNQIPIEPGVTYRCPLPDNCVPISVENPDNENAFIEQVRRHIQIEKEHGWFGAAMSLHEPTDSLIVCAPRTILRLYDSPGKYFETMQGVCYKGALHSDNLHIVDKNFTTYNFSSPYWYSPLSGFAVHYPTSKENISPNSIQPIIGSPKHELFGSVKEIGENKVAELPIGSSLANFGYALTSGYYFDEKPLLIAAGAPGWQYVGQVVILESRADSLIVIVTINGKDVGEYFGASLATGDINNDGLDDLIVGAPHWKNDNGRVHIFLGNKHGFLQDQIVLLEGNADDGLFGYAVTSGDLDRDGFDDIIVGAPWENSGVIYVYNGAAGLTDLHLLKPSQRIEASAIGENILRFGFSLSNLVDIDGDGMSDFAVGAYASEHVVVLRSKPAVKTKITLSTEPLILLGSSKSFKLKACLNYSYPKIEDEIHGLESVIDFTIDKEYDRVEYSNRWQFFRYPGNCKFMDIKLKKNITNRVDVIKIVGTHQFYYMSRFDNCAKPKEKNMDTLCPTEYKTRFESTEMEIPFDIGCGMDDICHSSIFTKQYFQNTSDSTWIIGSDYLSLVLEIGNLGEAAYLTRVKFNIPRGVYLKSIPSSCQEEKDTGTLKVNCDVGNPLDKTMKSITLDFDMKNINNGSAHGTTLFFSAGIETRSVNKGVTEITVPLHLKANVSVSLSGLAYEDSYKIKKNERPANFTFLHNYQIFRFGVTPISEAFLIIDIPYKLGGVKFLSLLQHPRVSISGRMHECHVIDIPVIKPRSVDESSFKGKYTMLRTISTDSTQRESDKKIHSPFYNVSNPQNIDITYLNCSANNVECGQVVCKVLSLNTVRDVGQLQLRLFVTDLGLRGDTDLTEKVVHITTKAFIEVVDPKMQFIVPGAGIIVPVTTTIHYSSNDRSPEMDSISIWIILGSVILGLLVLCLLVSVLWKYEFFKRSKKEQMEILKRREVIPIMLCDSDCEQLDA